MADSIRATYMLWNRGRLLGETPLDFVRCIPRIRTGFLYPSPEGEKVLDRIGETPRATIALRPVLRNRTADMDLRQSTEYADYRAAMNAAASGQLELRSPNGTVIPTNDIYVADFGFLLDEFDEELAELGDADDDEFDDLEVDSAEESTFLEGDTPLDFDDWPSGEAWRPDESAPERAWSRFQIQVELVDESAIP